jgi:NADH-quinone oxidoreductase subunit G
VAGRLLNVTYDNLENAPTVLLAGFEPEEESPIVYLRLRKAVRKRGLAVHAIAPYLSRGLEKLSATLIPVMPGGEPRALTEVARSDLLARPGSVMLVGERLAAVPGALTAAAALAREVGVKLAWIPRRAGERGALEVGALPGLLPGGRPVTDPDARAQLGPVWGSELPDSIGLDTDQMFAAATAGSLGALVVGGIEIDDLPDPEAARTALDAAPFVVSLEVRTSDVTDRADVVFPVAPVVEKSGTFVDWEGRPRSFAAALATTDAMSDHRVLDAIAKQMGMELGLPDPGNARDELASLGAWTGPDVAAPAVVPVTPPVPARGEAVLASWRMLLDSGRMQDGEPHLAGTARRPVIRISATTASENDLAADDLATVSTERGAITLPVEIGMLPDRVVWLPLNSPGSAVYAELGPAVGHIVRLRPADIGIRP